jgi:hypothetical protein
MCAIHKLLYQIFVQKAQAYPGRYGKHFCGGRFTKSFEPIINNYRSM